MKKTLNEFKKFAMRGNVVDMAVGIIIGGAFGKIVSSLVGDLIMPAVGVLVGGVNFSDLKWVIKHAVMEGDKVVSPEVAISYGNFIQVVFDFLEAKTPPAPPADIQLLTEIRDLLKEKKESE